MTSTPIKKARKLRRLQSNAESFFWQEIRNNRLGFKFRRQLPIGRFIADFACLELKIVIEIDGGQHCENQKDEARTAFLDSLGFKVVRFWNNDVLGNMEGVLSTLTLTLSQRERELEKRTQE